MQFAKYAGLAQAAALALLLPALAQAESYRLDYLDIMTEWRYTSGVSIYAINSSNQAVGYVSFGPELPGTPFLYDSPQRSYLRALSDVYDINNAGVMAGVSQDGVATIMANGQTTALLNDGRYSTATAINNHGVAVGYATANSPISYRAWVYSNGTATDLGTLGGAEAYATDINDAGAIVGRSRLAGPDIVEHAFIYQNGVMTDLGAPAGAINSTALAITADGSVLGTGYMPNGTAKGFLYRDGEMTDLSGIFTRSVLDINNAGTILGETNQGYILYNKHGQIYDLSLEVAQTGSTLARVFAISDNGTVGAEICNNLGCSAALMIPSPVPEPGTYAMLLAGLGVVGCLGRRRRMR